MLKVLTIVGTRPEIIRLSRIIHEFDQNFNHILAHTGQNFDHELNKVFFSDLQIRDPDYFMNCASGNESTAEIISRIISSSDEIMERESPDCVVVLGDTNSALAIISAKKRKIPIFHLEAGNRCFDQRVPEEVNRKIVDHLSDINMPYSQIARDYLINEGFPADQIIKIGSPMYEVLDYYSDGINKSLILDNFKLEPKKYFLISAHREENIDSDESFLKFLSVLDLLASHYKLPVIVSTHPRTRKKINNKSHTFNNLIRFEKPLGFFDYIHLQKKAKVVLSDSGTISEESSILGLNALNIRDVNERPEAMEEASVIMTGLDKDLIKSGIDFYDSSSVQASTQRVIVRDYQAPNVSTKVAKIVLSYTHFINARVWKK
jgi:UDP-N-acetylglucosamine 2-epimerase